MIKGVTKNLQATSPTCTRSPLRESMQSGSNLTKNPSSENLPSTVSMATALVTTNSTTVSLSDSGHSSYLNGDLSVEPTKPLKLTFKRNKAPSDTASIPSPSTRPDDCSKSSDSQSGSGVSIISMHADNSSLHRHPAVNGKMLPSTSSSSVSHSVHGEQTRSGSKRTSGSSANKRPKSASKRDRNTTNKPGSVLSLNSSSASNALVNGRSSSSERNHDPYQFSVKKEDETILPPKKLRLDSSLSRLSDRSDSHKDQATNTRNQGTSVDADLLGPCEPGTHINLDGYVCLETLTGMLMVSVMWRGRTYLGTLIDSSSHGFSPPIPPSYVYASHRYVSGMDASGASTSSSANGRNQRGRGKRRCGFAPTSSARHSRKGRRNPRGSPVAVTSSGAPSSNQSLLGGDDSNEETQSRGESPASENALDDEEAIMRYQCPQTGCHKRFKEVKAMKFHHDECHTKKTVSEPCSDSESREKRSKSTKSVTKSKKHSTNNGTSSTSSSKNSTSTTNAQSSVKTELSSSLASSFVGADNVTIKSEGADTDAVPPFFKAPVNNGLSSPPVLAYSPSSPSVPSLPNSPANGLKLPVGGATSANTQNGPPEMLSLPLHSTASSSSSSHTTKSLAHTPQHHQQPQGTSVQPSSDLSVRIPATNNLMVRVGVSSSSGATISTASVNSSSSTSRTVAAVTVPVTTIPVMKPSTVASSSASSSSLVSSGKKVNSKDPKSGSSGSSKSASSRASSHASGTITASSVTIPRATSPTAQTGGSACASSLKPIQPKPQSSAASSPSPGGAAKSLSGSSGAPIASASVSANASADGAAGKRPSSVNPSRKRKKSSGVPSEGNSKRQSIVSCPAGRNTQPKPSMAGGKRSSGDGDAQSAAEGSNSNQGDRASPAYSDISDDNESPIPILEKEGDVKILVDSVASGDEVGKASEQASGGGAFYNTPPSLVPFSVYSGDQATIGNGGNVGSGAQQANTASGRPGTIVKKGSSPGEPGSGNQVRSTGTIIPGTSPLSLPPGGPPLKRMDSSGRSKGDLNPNGAARDVLDGSTPVDGGEKAPVDNKGRVTTLGEEERTKKTSEPPNLTKIPTSLSLSIPSSSAVASSATTATTVAKPTPLNPLSPSRSSSDVPASAPAVVTPGALVGPARTANELYAARPDHLRTPPSFHPGPPFGPGAAAAAAAQFAAHMSPSALGPQAPFPPYSEPLMRFVPNGPHPPGHPFSGFPYGEPFFGGGPPPVSSAPQPHKIHELVEKGAASCASTSASPCTSTATSAACGGLVTSKPSVGVDAASALDLQTAKSYADMAVAMRHHASMVPNHSGLPQGPTHAGMVPAHFQFAGGIPPAHMTGPAFAAMQQHSLPPGHPPGHAGPDHFFSPSSIMNHPLYK